MVAIKLMDPKLAVTSPPRKRFLREARTAAAVSHENIVAIHAVEEEPIPYLVMEYIPGETLQRRMDEHGPLDVPEILRIGQQLASGLAAAQKADLIHRDIKPSNVLLMEGPGGRAKISDFGLARAVDDATLSTSGLIAGTPMYMAPEQALGQTLDPRADLFSLGSVLYQMASGRPPFRAENTAAVLKRVCEDAPRPITEVNPDTPDWLCSIIGRLLEKNPDDRYQTAQEVSDLLARCESELQLNGKVTCVGKRSGFRQKVVGGLLAAAALILLSIFSSVENIPDQDPRTGPGPVLPESAGTASSSTGESTGWQGWPVGAPAPAIAPFDDSQAKAHQEAWADYLNIPVEYKNSLGMTFVLIPPGEFVMGSSTEEIEEALTFVEANDTHWRVRVQSEAPQHKVILTQPVYLCATEVTQGQYERVMNTNPSWFSATGEGKSRVENLDTQNHPVDMVSWHDAAEFCTRLSQLEQLEPHYFRSGETITPVSGTGYRLPTEAEWEFACRAGTTTRFWSGETESDLIPAGWFGSNSGYRTHSVGELNANPFGLFDVHGNVWEWVQDSWESGFYEKLSKSPAVNPNSPFLDGMERVVRGGHWETYASDCSSSSRRSYGAMFPDNHFGFRVTLSLDAVRNREEARVDSSAKRLVSPTRNR